MIGEFLEGRMILNGFEEVLDRNREDKRNLIYIVRFFEFLD